MLYDSLMLEIHKKRIEQEPSDSPCKKCDAWKDSALCGCSKHKEYKDKQAIINKTI